MRAITTMYSAALLASSASMRARSFCGSSFMAFDFAERLRKAVGTL